MRITYRKSGNTRRWKPLFVTASEPATDSFPVPVRYLQLGQPKTPETSPENADRDPQGILQPVPPGMMNPIDVVDRVPGAARQTARHVVTFWSPAEI